MIAVRTWGPCNGGGTQIAAVMSVMVTPYWGSSENEVERVLCCPFLSIRFLSLPTPLQNQILRCYVGCLLHQEARNFILHVYANWTPEWQSLLKLLNTCSESTCTKKIIPPVISLFRENSYSHLFYSLVDIPFFIEKETIQFNYSSVSPQHCYFVRFPILFSLSKISLSA